ncbi:MAG: dUTP diphosphatase [Clostridia bacterium]
MDLKFIKIPSADGKIIDTPQYATDGSACFDLVCNLDDAIVIKSNEIAKIPTGIAIELESNLLVALVYPRSGLSSKFGISLANCVGVVDSDYRGQIFVPLVNNSDVDFTLKPDERIAQLAVMPILKPTLIEVENLSETTRGSGGFGSTGK